MVDKANFLSIVTRLTAGKSELTEEEKQAIQSNASKEDVASLFDEDKKEKGISVEDLDGFSEEELDLITQMNTDGDSVISFDEVMAAYEKEFPESDVQTATTTPAASTNLTPLAPLSVNNKTTMEDYLNDELHVGDYSAVLNRSEYPEGWTPKNSSHLYEDENGVQYTKINPKFLGTFVDEMGLSQNGEDIVDKNGNVVGKIHTNSDGTLSFFLLTDEVKEVKTRLDGTTSASSPSKSYGNSDTFKAKTMKDIYISKGYNFDDNGKVLDKSGNEVGTYVEDDKGITINWSSGAVDMSIHVLNADGKVTEKCDVHTDENGTKTQTQVAFYDNGKPKQSAKITVNSDGTYKRVDIAYDESGKSSSTKTATYSNFDDANNEKNPISTSQTGNFESSAAGFEKQSNGTYKLGNTTYNGVEISKDGYVTQEIGKYLGIDKSALEVKNIDGDTSKQEVRYNGTLIGYVVTNDDGSKTAMIEAGIKLNTQNQNNDTSSSSTATTTDVDPEPVNATNTNTTATTTDVQGTIPQNPQTSTEENKGEPAKTSTVVSNTKAIQVGENVKLNNISYEPDKDGKLNDFDVDKDGFIRDKNGNRIGIVFEGKRYAIIIPSLESGITTKTEDKNSYILDTSRYENFDAVCKNIADEFGVEIENVRIEEDKITVKNKDGEEFLVGLLAKDSNGKYAIYKKTLTDEQIENYAKGISKNKNSMDNKKLEEFLKDPSISSADFIRICEILDLYHTFDKINNPDDKDTLRTRIANAVIEGIDGSEELAIVLLNDDDYSILEKFVGIDENGEAKLLIKPKSLVRIITECKPSKSNYYQGSIPFLYMWYMNNKNTDLKVFSTISNTLMDYYVNNYNDENEEDTIEKLNGIFLYSMDYALSCSDNDAEFGYLFGGKDKNGVPYLKTIVNETYNSYYTTDWSDIKIYNYRDSFEMYGIESIPYAYDFPSKEECEEEKNTKLTDEEYIYMFLESKL